MKKILLSITLLFSLNCFSQEIFLGKTSIEIQSSVSNTHVGYIQGRSAVFSLVDSNTTDVYYLNKDGVCIEYSRIISNTTIGSVETFLSHLIGENWYEVSNIWFENTKGLVALVTELSANSLYKINIRKNIN